jgi:CRISPR-associated Csx3 family protein
MVKYNVKEGNEFVLVEFKLKNEKISPKQLNKIRLPPTVSGKGVVIKGHGPTWFHCFLTNYYHAADFVAIFDHDIDGAVVVQSHTDVVDVGDVIKIQTHFFSILSST